MLDTARNIQAMQVDMLVVRHQTAGAAAFLARNLEAAVINAGDGAHEHPTQGLLDIYTIREHKGTLDGVRVLIVGDMRELGPASEPLHRQVAEQIGRAGIDLAVTIGENARLMADAIEESSEGLTETHAHGSVALTQRRLISYLRGSDTILIKGSRALAPEKLAAVIRDWAEKPPDQPTSKKEPSSARRLTV